MARAPPRRYPCARLSSHRGVRDVMARSAARGRRASGRGGSGSRGSRSSSGAGFGRWAAESAGVVLIVASAIGALALATYTPDDPLFRLTEVANGAGVVGATLAGLLRSAAGWGSSVLVGVAVVVGGRLVLGRGLPGPRFWLGAISLLVALATLAPLLAAAGVSGVDSSAGGLLGAWLASGERILLSLWGALLVNGLLALGGALSVVRIPLGRALRVAIAAGARALRAIPVVLRAVAGVALQAGEAGAQGVARGAAAGAAGAAAAAAGARQALAQSWQAVAVRRARRARKARFAPPADATQETLEAL